MADYDRSQSAVIYIGVMLLAEMKGEGQSDDKIKNFMADYCLYTARALNVSGKQLSLAIFAEFQETMAEILDEAKEATKQ